MTTIAFFAQGLPKGQPRARAFAMKFGNKFQARMYDAGTAEGWKGCVASAAKEFIPATPLEIPIRLTLMFWMPRPKNHYRTNGKLKENAPVWFTGKPDTDNLQKAVQDALTIIGMWKDDALVVKSTTVKAYTANGKTGCDVTIEGMDDTEHVPAEQWVNGQDSVVQNLL